MAKYDTERFKLAIPEWCLPGDSIFSIRLASELGLQGIQLEAGFPFTGFKLSHRRVRELYVETARQYGIELIAIALNNQNNHGLRHGRGTEAGDIAYEELDTALTAAGEMGIPVIMVPHFVDNDLHTDEDWKNAVAALQYACDAAKDRGTIIAAETAIPGPDFVRMAGEVNRENLKLFYDSQNYMCFRGFNPMDHLPTVYPYMTNMLHVKDGIGDAYSSRRLGEGDSHFAEQIAWLKANGYRGWFIFENYYTQLPLRKEAKDPIDILKQDMATLEAELAK